MARRRRWWGVEESGILGLRSVGLLGSATRMGLGGSAHGAVGNMIVVVPSGLGGEKVWRLGRHCDGWCLA